jgi:nucleotide-binding universal stress UspA family protein
VEQWLIAICADAEKRLYAEAAMLAKQTELQVESVLSRGRAAEQIVAVAVERKADLIAISTHGYTGLSHLIFGSIAEKVVRISPIPVLSVKPPKIVETTKLFE